MPRNVTVTFADGTSHVYQNVPDEATPDQVSARAAQEFAGKSITALNGGRKADPKPEGSITDAPNAVATGFNQAVLRLAGLPVDTIANVRDLGKAGLGSAYIAATGKEPPQWLQVGDRANDTGSGDNLIRGVRKVAPAIINAQNPEYEGGMLQAAGGGLTAIVNPKSRLELLNQGVLGVAGAMGGKAVADATGNPALAAIATLAPHGVQQAATIGVKTAVRGGEVGRKQMEQRIQDLKNAGVDNPTVGLASGNGFVGGVENLLQNTPGAVGIMRNARENAIAGLQGKAGEAAANASTNRGTTESGVSIQSGTKAFKELSKATQAKLYAKLDQFIASSTPTRLDNTSNTLDTLTAPIPNAPETSKLFANARISGLKNALQSDLADNAAAANASLVPPTARGGQPTPPALQGAPAPGMLPWEAVKKTRTLVGNELADHSLMSDVPRSKWNPIYGALSEDMSVAANQAGPDATNAFNRATDYTRASIGRLERVAPTVDKPSPEQTFSALERSLKENTSTFQAVKKTLPEGARGDFAGTVIERLGKAKPGQQDAAGEVWSPETFLTNWNSIAPKARAEMLSGFPNSAQVAADVDAIANAASMMRGNSKLWGNPSGTAANLAARGTLGAVGLGGAGALAGVVSPAIPLAAAAGVGGANLLARGLTSKRVVNALARQDTPSERLTQADINALVSYGLLSGQTNDEQNKRKGQ